ncbi:MAG: bifunctional phosphoribosyl-AMP cyclohydrolase/phosphoribosyl-ATP diphosphatase HisIE [Acidobacteriota bacterium]
MNLNYEKYADGLVPAIIQDDTTGTVLMLGFMNNAALRETEVSGRVTFFSRSRQQLWMKGETSGNCLDVISITADCDQDTLLIRAIPTGPVCHTGTATCFGENNKKVERPVDLLNDLEGVIDRRVLDKPSDSYVAKLFAKGINKIAQKVGEEAVELVIEAKDDDLDKFLSEAADLLFHYLLLLRAKDASISDVLGVLKSRRR